MVEFRDWWRAEGGPWTIYCERADCTLPLLNASPLTLLETMCESQGWKSGGDKQRIMKRFCKKISVATSGREGAEALIEATVGKTNTSDISALIRRHYTDNYAALDRFDRLWYETKFPCRTRDWKSYFCWSLLHCAVINARAAWCLSHRTRVTMKDYIKNLIADAREECSK